MAWRDNLRQASFRGAPFHFEEASGPIGRRFARHEYAARDGAYHEDLGRRAREISIRAYVIGDDYMAARDRLMAAVEAPGPATLVHPYQGAIRAVCTGCVPREAARAGGMAAFDLTFEEDGENRFPVSLGNTVEIVRMLAAAANAAITVDFMAFFHIDGLASWAVTKARDTFGGGLDAVGDSANTLISDARLAASFARKLAASKAEIDVLLDDPSRLADTVIDLIEQITGMSDARSVIVALADIDALGAGDSSQPGTTAATIAVNRNTQSLNGLFRRAAAVAAARASADVDFTRRGEAIAVRDRLSARLDALMIEAGDSGEDAAWAALASLRAALVRDINLRAANLPRLVIVTPATTLPALVIANRLYGDDPAETVSRADQIVAFNDIRHPGFVPAGDPLSVLTLETANG